MKTMTRKEWQDELSRRMRANLANSGDVLDVGFRCPRCGNVATVSQFVDFGEKADRAPQECIGRVLSERRSLGDGVYDGGTTPCDWAAFGLFGTMGRGVLIRDEDGSTTEVFDFAEPAAECAGNREA